MISDAAQSSTWIDSEVQRLRRCDADAMIAPCWAISVIVMDPVARGEEREGGEEGDDQHQDPGQGRGIAHAEIGEGLLIEVERIEERGADRPASALADDEGRGEAPERVDRWHDAVEEDDRGEQRQGDPEELAAPARALDAGRVECI